MCLLFPTCSRFCEKVKFFLFSYWKVLSYTFPPKIRLTSAITGCRMWAEKEVQDIPETSSLSGKDLSSPCVVPITISRAPGFLNLAWIWILILGYVQICEVLPGCILKLL